MILRCAIWWRGWFLILSYSEHPRFPIKQAMTSCPAKRPRVTNAHAECAQSCVSLHPSQPPARKIGATCHPLRIRLSVAGGDSDSSHRHEVFNAFIIRGLMTPSLTHHLQWNLLRIQQPPCARKKLACDIHWPPPLCLLLYVIPGESTIFLHLKNICTISLWILTPRIEHWLSSDSWLINRKQKVFNNFWRKRQYILCSVWC